MSITYSISPREKLVLTKVRGHLGLEDALAHSHNLKTDPLFRPEYSELIDLTAFTGTDLNLEAMKAFARGLQGEVFSHHARRAVVAPADSVFDLSSRYQSMKPNVENFQVFHSMDEATQWLGITPNKAMLFE
jgi:hypothetical protein